MSSFTTTPPTSKVFGRYSRPTCSQTIGIASLFCSSSYTQAQHNMAKAFIKADIQTVTQCRSPMALCAAGCILQAKLPSLNTQPPPGSPRLTILSASSVRTLVHCVVKYSRPPDLKSSSNVSLSFAWITGPATDPSLVSNHSVSVYFLFFFGSPKELVLP